MHILKNRKYLNHAAISICLTLAPIYASAEAYRWTFDGVRFDDNPLDACRYRVITSNSDPARNRTVLPETIYVAGILYDWSRPGSADASCGYDVLVTDLLAKGYYMRLSPIDLNVGRWGDGCDATKTYNLSTGVCGQDNEKGVPDQFSCVGNPISVKSGNKFQKEIDYSDGVLEVSRIYNSLDGLWRSVFSDTVRAGDNKFYVSRADGSNSSYTTSGGSIIPDVKGTGNLKKTSAGWEYSSPIGEVLEFNTTGRLIRYVSQAGSVRTISYDYSTLKISVDSKGNKTLFLTLDSQGQPLLAKVGDITLTYNYENYRLSSVSKQAAGKVSVRKFLYEKGDKKLLTGVVNENGARFASWNYDDQGRAISSQHAGGAGITQVEYLDGASVVTNELGKKTTYKYQQVHGINRITSIVGEPSPNCPASNSNYTYNVDGQLESVTDAKGLVTVFTYNERGLEASRTESKGTSLERTTYTEWHPERALPLRVTASGRVTEYSYDDVGRLLSQDISPQRIPIGEEQPPNTVPVSPSPGTPITLPPRPN